jgi:hypothetical protein
MKAIIPLVLCSLVLCVSCTTTNHTVFISETDLQTPVSASGFFVGPGSTVYGKDSYTVVEHFALDGRFENPSGAKGYMAMDLKKYLDPVIKRDKADAIVNLQIYAKQYDMGNMLGIGIMRNVGISAGVVAGLFLLTGAFDDTGTSEGIIKMSDIGLGFAIPAAIGLGGSYLLEMFSKTAWTIGIEGDAVKLKSTRK